MRLNHGALGIDLPPDWRNQSTLLFVAPRPKLNLPSTAEVQQPTEAISISFYYDTQSPQALLGQQAEQLGQVHPGFAVIDDGPISSGLGDGWRYTQDLDMDGTPVRQIAAAFAIGPVTVLATAATVRETFEARREELTQILCSLSLEAIAP